MIYSLFMCEYKKVTACYSRDKRSRSATHATHSKMIKTDVNEISCLFKYALLKQGKINCL